MVRRGEKGVWVDVLDPGKYAINTYTHKVRVVPTANERFQEELFAERRASGARQR